MAYTKTMKIALELSGTKLWHYSVVSLLVACASLVCRNFEANVARRDIPNLKKET